MLFLNFPDPAKVESIRSGIGIGLDGPSIVVRCLRHSRLIEQQGAQVAVGPVEFRVALNRLAVSGFCGIELAQVMISKADIVVGVRVVGSQCQRGLVGINRGLILSLFVQSVAKVVVHRGRLRVDFQSPPIRCGRGFIVVLFLVDRTEIVVRLEIVGIGLKKLLIGNYSFIEPPVVMHGLCLLKRIPHGRLSLYSYTVITIRINMLQRSTGCVSSFSGDVSRL